MVVDWVVWEVVRVSVYTVWPPVPRVIVIVLGDPVDEDEVDEDCVVLSVEVVVLDETEVWEVELVVVVVDLEVELALLVLSEVVVVV